MGDAKMARVAHPAVGGAEHDLRAFMRHAPLAGEFVAESALGKHIDKADLHVGVALKPLLHSVVRRERNAAAGTVLKHEDSALNGFKVAQVVTAGDRNEAHTRAAEFAVGVAPMNEGHVSADLHEVVEARAATKTRAAMKVFSARIATKIRSLQCVRHPSFSASLV